MVADRPDRNLYDVKVRVISQRGDCGQGHKVGDEFVVKSANGSRHTPAGICLSAFNALYPALRALAFGGSMPWAEDPDVSTCACPDGENPVIFELRRIRAQK